MFSLDQGDRPFATPSVIAGEPLADARFGRGNADGGFAAPLAQADPEQAALLWQRCDKALDHRWFVVAVKFRRIGR